MEKNREAPALIIGMLNSVQIWKTVQWFLKKFIIELPYDPAILILGIHPRKMKAYVHTKAVM